MATIAGTYRKGKIALDETVDWPEGARVEVILPLERIGLSEAEYPTTPEGLAALAAEIRQLEPLIMTPEEEAAWLAALEEADEISREEVAKQMGLSR